MIIPTLRILTGAVLTATLTVPAQPPANAPSQADIQQRVAALKASIAANRQQLSQYQWLQTTEVSVKGEVKRDQQQQCHYGPDGKVVKTPVGDQPEQQQQNMRGIKKHIVEKKVDEMKDYVDRVKSLIGHYVPPDPESIQSAVQAGRASLNRGAAFTTIIFSDYYKPGDKVTFGFDSTAKKLRAYDISTYLDDPTKDPITLTNHFSSLPDGTNYLRQTVVDITAKQIKITNSNSGYSKIN